MLPYPAALLHRILVVLLKQAPVGIGTRTGETGAVDEPIEGREVLKETFFKNGLKVKLHVTLTADIGTVAQETKDLSVGDQPPEGLGAVQELLYQGMRGEAGPPRGRHFAGFLRKAYDVHRRGVFVLSGLVGRRGGVVAELVAKKTQEWNNPELTSKTGF